MYLTHNQEIKQALREAIERRKRDMERFVIELQRIEKEEREQDESVLRQMQDYPNG